MRYKPRETFSKTAVAARDLSADHVRQLWIQVDVFLNAVITSHVKHSQRWLRMPLVLYALGTSDGAKLAADLVDLPAPEGLGLEVPKVLPELPRHQSNIEGWLEGSQTLDLLDVQET
jgi:hypothetical protein